MKIRYTLPARALKKATILAVPVLALVVVSSAAAEFRGSFEPTISCSKIKTPLALILCSEKNAATADWEVNAAAWAYAFLLEDAARERFWQQHDAWITSVTATCRLTPAMLESQRKCVVGAYRTRAKVLQSRLTADALAETKLTPDERATIQARLVSLGFLRDEPDGEFGKNTRAAIRKFQEANGFKQASFLTAEQREMLLTFHTEVPSSHKTQQLQSRIDDARAPDATAEALDGCPGVERGAFGALAIRVANPNPARLLNAVRQELSRRGLTRAQIKRCAPQVDLFIVKIEQCVASGDMECRFSQQEVDEFNKLNAPADASDASDDCPSIIQRAGEAVATSVSVSAGNIRTLLDTVRQEFSRRKLTRTQVKQCFPAIDSLVEKLERCVANGDTKCLFSSQEAYQIEKLNARSILLHYESKLRLPHSWTDCSQGRAFGEPTVVPPSIDLEQDTAELGREKVYQILILAANWLSSCGTERGAPEGWSDRRLMAMAIMDAALPIKVVNTDASPDCDSVLTETRRRCELLVDYTIENKTDDMTFPSIAVACLGQLTSPSGEISYRLANAQYDPIVSSGRPLGPHGTQAFHFWYGVGHLGLFKLTREEIAKGGSSRWCHVLAARAEPLPSIQDKISRPDIPGKKGWTPPSDDKEWVCDGLTPTCRRM